MVDSCDNGWMILCTWTSGWQFCFLGLVTSWGFLLCVMTKEILPMFTWISVNAPALVCIIMVWSKEMLQVLVVPPFFKKKKIIASIASIAYLWKVEMMKDVYLYLRSHFELLHLEILSFGPFSLYLLRKQFRGVGGLSDLLALQKLEPPLVLQHDWGEAEVLIWCTFRWIIWCIDWLDDGTSPIRHHHYHPPMLLITSKQNVGHTQAPWQNPSSFSG